MITKDTMKSLLFLSIITIEIIDVYRIDALFLQNHRFLYKIVLVYNQGK